VLPQKANCLAFVRIRKSGVCFASKRNDEERSAKLFCDDKKVFVEETPGGILFVESEGRKEKDMFGDRISWRILKKLLAGFLFQTVTHVTIPCLNVGESATATARFK
jgi:hypothetical protein